MNSFKSFIKHLFIPHEGNNFRAKALDIDFLTYYLLFAVFLSFGFKILNSNPSDVLGYATDISVDKLYQLTNTVRQQNQLPSLTYNEQLEQAAKKKAQDMFSKNYWSHYGPGGETPWDFILSAGYKYEYAGENLAKNFLFSQGVIDAWLASPSHRENILRKDYSDIGFAVVNGLLNGEETTLVVEMFGKPLHIAAIKESSTINQPPIRPIAAEAKTIEVAKTEELTQAESQSKPDQQEIIMANKSSQPANNFASYFSFTSSYIFLSFLVLALILDIYFANKLRVVRITGKSFAHLLFVTFIFIGLFIIVKGSIM